MEKIAEAFGFDVGLIMVLFILIVGVILFFWLIPVRLWVAAFASGAHVGIFRLVGMRLRRVPPHRIVNARIMAVKAGLEVEIDKMEAHFLAGGNIEAVIMALISADKANIPLSFDRAVAIDLAGRQVFEAVQMSVNPKVINTPKIAAVAKDGIQLMAICRITVRANIDRLVGGAGEETIIARVGEGIVTTIGSANDFKEVLENPDTISKTVLKKSLDSGTAFEILSVDIADVDVGTNIGAKLNIEKAEADKQIAQAQAESRRALAVAAEQEMKARVQEMQARLVEAESQVPIAIAEALRKGNMGVMDFYNLKNIMADTDMRSSISGMSRGPDKPKGQP
ncbi:MAG: flotillin-like protein FloA [Pseudomonadota bacterium]